MTKIGYPQHTGKFIVNGYHTLEMVRTIRDPQILVNMDWIKDLKQFEPKLLDKLYHDHINKNNNNKDDDNKNIDHSADSNESNICYPDQWVNGKQTSFRGLKEESDDNKITKKEEIDEDGNQKNDVDDTDKQVIV